MISKRDFSSCGIVVCRHHHLTITSIARFSTCASFSMDEVGEKWWRLMGNRLRGRSCLTSIIGIYIIRNANERWKLEFSNSVLICKRQTKISQMKVHNPWHISVQPHAPRIYNWNNEIQTPKISKSNIWFYRRLTNVYTTVRIIC